MNGNDMHRAGVNRVGSGAGARAIPWDIFISELR